MHSLATGLAVEGAATARATAADVERDLIPELRWLEISLVVQRLAAITALRLGGYMRALTLTNLRNTSRSCAA
jgi:hypothetical protein